VKRFFIIFLFVFCFSPFVLYAKTTTQPIKILIAPGHNNEIWGAQYGNIKEADMNLFLGTQIYNLLKKDKRFKVYITRNSKGYTKEFSNYFSKNRAEIISFKNNAKKDTQIKINNGTLVDKNGVAHVGVNEETAIELYGINKWADETKIDAIINVHFNDYPRPDKWTIGVYKGFVVYLPDAQMVNAAKSSKLAKNIFSQLSKKYITSTYVKEKGGFIPDQKLIALGASGTLNKNVSSVLVEYGYIYQKIFRNSKTRHQAYKDMALLTTKGISNCFFKK